MVCGGVAVASLVSCPNSQEACIVPRCCLVHVIVRCHFCLLEVHDKKPHPCIASELQFERVLCLHEHVSWGSRQH
jgi:hypothetical protein